MLTLTLYACKVTLTLQEEVEEEGEMSVRLPSMVRSHRVGGKYDEISIGGESFSPLVLLPDEITQMQNHSARQEFIEPPALEECSHKKQTLYGIIATGVSRMLGFSRPHTHTQLPSSASPTVNRGGGGSRLGVPPRPPPNGGGARDNILECNSSTGSVSAASSVSTTGSGPLNPIVASDKSINNV